MRRLFFAAGWPPHLLAPRKADVAAAAAAAAVHEVLAPSQVQPRTGASLSRSNTGAGVSHAAAAAANVTDSDGADDADDDANGANDVEADAGLGVLTARARRAAAGPRRPNELRDCSPSTICG